MVDGGAGLLCGAGIRTRAFILPMAACLRIISGIATTEDAAPAVGWPYCGSAGASGHRASPGCVEKSSLGREPEAVDLQQSRQWTTMR
jgi:hypothetical protein